MDELLHHSTHTAIQHPPRSGKFIICVAVKHLFEHLKIPEIQREIDTDHVDYLALQFKEEYEKMGYVDIGRFDIAFFGESFYLVNGQHRFHALQSLGEAFRDITVEAKVCLIKSETDMGIYFQRVNTSKPVKIYHSVDAQQLGNGIRKLFTERFGKYLSPSENPRRPNMNLNRIMQHIENLDILRIMEIDQANQFMEHVNALNSFYEETPIDTWKRWHKGTAIEGYLDKCKQRNIMDPCFLGIYPVYEWLDRILACHTGGLGFHQVAHPRISYRPTIRQTKRRALWKKRNNPDENLAKCYVCATTDINQFDFVCGHVVSVFHGGSSDIGNLEAICSGCNSEMGTENLEVYKAREWPLGGLTTV